MAQSYQGICWGQVAFKTNQLYLYNSQQNQRQVVSIKYEQIKNIGKNKKDIFMQLKNSIEDEDQLSEIRFYVQEDEQNISITQETEKKDKQISPQIFLEEIKKRIFLGNSQNKSIVTFNNIHLISPRGNYTIDLSLKILKFHGQSYSFQIDNKHITKAFFLPMDNQSQILIILQLHKQKPLYYGSTMHRYLAFQFKINEQAQVSINLKEHQPIFKEKQLKKIYNGRHCQIFTELLKIIYNLTILAPNLEDFCSKNSQTCVRCTLKAQTGWVYFFRKSLMFIPKPIISIRLEQIKNVQLLRFNSNSRHFDIKIHQKNQKKLVELLNIDKKQLQNIVKYLTNHQIALKQQISYVGQNKLSQGDSDQDDEDFHSGQQNESDSASQKRQDSYSQDDQP